MLPLIFVVIPFTCGCKLVCDDQAGLDIQKLISPFLRNHNFFDKINLLSMLNEQLIVKPEVFVCFFPELQRVRGMTNQGRTVAIRKRRWVSASFPNVFVQTKSQPFSNENRVNSVSKCFPFRCSKMPGAVWTLGVNDSKVMRFKVKMQATCVDVALNR